MIQRTRYIVLLIGVCLFAPSLLSQTSRSTAKAKPTVAKPSASAMEIPAVYRDLLDNASQAVVVTTAGWDSVDGTLLRYEKKDGKWQPVGGKIPIVVGKNGLAPDQLTEMSMAKAKREGDGRSPGGIFNFGDSFGFEPSAPNVKLSYRQLTNSIECVDDASSSAYNEIVDRQQMPHPDWSSSEKMRTVDQYKEGAVVNYNDQRVPGAGSCIFMHIWSGAGHGTAGCTAMSEEKLLELLAWLDPAKKPVLIQFPGQVYQSLRETWQLP